LEQAIALSERQGRWTKWTQLALNDLNAIDPKAYPPQKQEVLYPIASIFVAPASAIKLAYPEGMEPPVVDQDESNTESGEDTSLNTTLEGQDETLTPEGAPEENAEGEQGNGPSEPESGTENAETELGWGTPTDADSEEGDESQEPSDGSEDSEKTEQTTDKEDESEDQDTGDSQ
jgi:hypothetical protein